MGRRGDRNQHFISITSKEGQAGCPQVELPTNLPNLHHNQSREEDFFSQVRFRPLHSPSLMSSLSVPKRPIKRDINRDIIYVAHIILHFHSKFGARMHFIRSGASGT